METIIIGIAGGTASGKSSIARHLKSRFEETQKVGLIRMDDYYKDQKDDPMDVRLSRNYDHPFAFDIELLVQDLKTLKRRESIQKPVYDFMQYTRSEYSEQLAPSDVIILDGLMVLEDEHLRALLDIKVFVDTPSDIRFIRRLTRDVNKRGRSLESVIDQYLSTVRVMHEQFVEPSKRYADIIIPEGAHNKVALDLLTTKISSILNKV